MSFRFSAGDFITVARLVSLIIAALGSVIVVGEYKARTLTLSGHLLQLEELGRSLDWMKKNMTDISELELGEDSRLREAVGTVMELLRHIQEQLAREGIPRPGFESFEVTTPLCSVHPSPFKTHIKYTMLTFMRT